MRNLIHKTNWSQTALGPAEHWPRSLRSLVEMILDHPIPMTVLWGPDFIQIYNDAYAAIVNRKHPSALGKSTRENSPEIWDVVEPILRRVMDNGETILTEDRLYRTKRSGELEDAYFTVAYSPAHDDEGKIAGVLATVIETTKRILAEQQRVEVEKAVREAAEADAFRVKLADAVRALSDPLEIQNTAARLLGEHLGANRVAYGDIVEESEAVIGGMYLDRIYPLPSPIPIAAFGEWMLEAYRQNETIIINDVATDARIADQERGSFKLMGVAAAMSTSLIKNGRWLACMGADSTTPRQWTSLEVALLKETASRTWAAVERARAEIALRIGEERQAFLLKLSDATRLVGCPVGVQLATAQMAMDHLNLDRCLYGEVEGDLLIVHRDCTKGDLASMSGTHPMAGSPVLLKLLRNGDQLVVPDINAAKDLDENTRFVCAQIKVGAFISTPLVKDRKLVGLFVAAQSVPRRWTTDEIRLCREIAERTWAAVERARAEAALREANERFLLAEEASNGYVYDLDVRTHTTTRSDGFKRITGYSNEDLGPRSQGWIKIIHPEDWQRLKTETPEELMAGKNSFSLEYRVRTKDGRWIYILDRGIGIRNEAGALIRIVGTTVDVTERYRIAEEREELLKREIAARAEAEHAAKMKEEFLAIVSHELRTPLTAGLIWAKLLQSGELRDDIQPAAVDKIVQSAEAQQRIIDDLLDVSRMISGKMRIKMRQAELTPVLKEAIEAITPMAQAKKIKVITRFEESRCRLRMDPDRIQQVMWNLLNNAVKFSDSGARVYVRMRCRNNSAEIRIRDTGRGISREFLPYVFERFRQQDASPSRPFGGLGIGLAIAKQLVELHGGMISAESDGEGKGAVFTITLPIARQGRAQASSPRSESQKIRSKVRNRPKSPRLA